MPAKQRGWVVKRGTSWQARWRDENGNPRGQGGFPTKTAARDWLDTQVDEVLALRRGELIPVAHRPRTVDALLDTFLESTVPQSTRRPGGNSRRNSGRRGPRSATVTRTA